MADQIFDGAYPKKDTPVLTDRVWGWDSVANESIGFELKDIMDAAGVPTTRIISSFLNITSPTAGTMTASWVGTTGIGRYLFEEALTFAGAPAATFFRFDNVLGNDNGTITVQTGTPATSNPVIPTAPSTSLILATILWNEAGEDQQVVTPTPFPEARYTTKIEPGTNGKFARLWEGDLSTNQNFQLHLSYGAPSSSQDWELERPGKSGFLILNFLCDPDGDILPNNVQFVTVDKFSTAGDFRLVQLAGGRAALLHASTDYWMRVEFRVLFTNSAFLNADFINNDPYTTIPAGTAWSSEQYGYDPTLVQSVSGDIVDITDPANPVITSYPDFEPSTGNILFSPLNGKPRKYGFTTALTGNIVFETTGAKETIMVKARWNAGTLPTVSVSGGGVTLIKDAGDFVISVDNYIDAICNKNDAGAVTSIRYSITQA